jgi:beta-glucosidase
LQLFKIEISSDCKNMKSILNYLLFFFLTGQCVTDFPFRNVSLPIEERLDDLLGRLTVAEILDQMSHGGGGGDGSPVPAIPELGIGTYSWGTECIHGDQSGNATSFPLSIGLAATFK